MGYRKRRANRYPETITYQFPSKTFTSAMAAESISVPEGRSTGTIKDIGVSVATTFACDATASMVRVGTSGDPDLYAELQIADATAATDTFTNKDDTDAIKKIINNDFDSNQIEVTFVVGTDGASAAGIGVPYVVIEWD